MTHDGAGRFSVVALGASAGGLDALCAFLDHLPSRPGFACVVVTHQAPGVVSHLPELLGRHSKVELSAAIDGATLEPDRVYVGSPGTQLTIQRGRLRVHEVPHRQALPIDVFLRSLAAELGRRAVAVILSGTGSDGTLGARQVHAAGGLVIAQEPASAAHGGMPQSVIAAGIAAAVLRPEAIPARLAAHDEERRRDGDAGARLAPEELQQIVEALRAHTGRDFSSYKATTVVRRVLRRMTLHGHRDAAEYIEHLTRVPTELDRLFDDLLIGVTSFFRDPKVWQTLDREILPGLLATTPPDRPFRAWVAGCATGEEAYTIAILLRDRLRDRSAGFQVFGTDLDAAAIELARTASYPMSIAADVGPEHAERSFMAERDRLRVRPEIRGRVIFAAHDMLSDPPFTRIDLVSCRNVLIYLEPVLQARVLARMRYALRTDGILILGTSESVGASPAGFEPVDAAAHVFRRGPGDHDDLSEVGRPRRLAIGGAAGASAQVADVGREVERLLAARYLPPGVVVDEHGDIVHVHGRTGRFLEPPQGRPSHNAFAMARPGLRLPMTAAVRTALERGVRVVHREIQMPDGAGAVDIGAEPLDPPGVPAGLVLVSFEPSRQPADGDPAPGAQVEALQIRELEHEVDRARAQLERTIGNLQAANQELQSANQELQSANEELETSREEVVSLNEELQSVNGELLRKVDVLSEVNDDMANLLESTDVATVFLDRELQVRRFTRPVTALIPLLEGDLGRPIGDLSPTMTYPDLVADAAQVLRTLVIKATPVHGHDGRHYLARVLPYRTVDNVIDGVVLTFVDTTELVHAQRLADSREIAVSVVETVREPLLVLDEQLRVVISNRAFAVSFRIASAAGVPLAELGAGAWNGPELRRLLVDVVEHDTTFEDLELACELPSIGRRRIVLNGRRLRRGDGGPVLVLVAMEVAGDREVLR